MRFLFGFFFIVILGSFTFSQNQKPRLKRGLAFIQNDTVHRNKGFFALPLLYYTPDTCWAAGLAGVVYFNTGHTDSLLDTRLSYVKVLSDYTQNKQTDVWAEWNIFSIHEKSTSCLIFFGGSSSSHDLDKIFGNRGFKKINRWRR
jgi:hypothetical protein